eukprot:3334860-Prymnesium_polylepis.2
MTKNITFSNREKLWQRDPSSFHGGHFRKVSAPSPRLSRQPAYVVHVRGARVWCMCVGERDASAKRAHSAEKRARES